MDMVVLELLQLKESIGTDIAMVFMAHVTGHMICHGLQNVANGMEKSVYQKEVNDYFLYLLKSDGKSCCNFFLRVKRAKKHCNVIFHHFSRGLGCN